MKNVDVLIFGLLISLMMLHLKMLSSAVIETNSCTGPGLCQPPNGVIEKFGGALSSEMEATIKAWCYAVCAKRNIGVVKITGKDTIWPRLSLTSLDCDKTISQVLECQRGCMTMFKVKTLKPNSCRNKCFESCNNENVTNYHGTTCQLACNKGACKTGCVLFREDMLLANSQQQPSSNPLLIPTLAPVVMKEHEEVASDEGVFLINYSVPLLNMSIAEVTNISVSSFVFKVEERDGNGMKYISEASLEDHLYLTPFFCQQVNISFAVVSSSSPPRGPLTFSPVQPNFCIEGEIFPHQFPYPYSLRLVKVEEDIREGFVGTRRARITVEWDRPDDFELVTGYRLTLQTFRKECGGPNERVFYVGRRVVAFLQESKLMKVLREGGKHETWLMCYLADPPQNCDWITTEYIKDGFLNNFQFQEASSLKISATTPTDMPTFGPNRRRACGYRATILVLPSREGDVPIFRNLARLKEATNIHPIFITNCSRSVNGTTGLISPMFKWKIEPSYSILESMWFINVIISEARLQGTSSFSVGVIKSNVSIARVGTRELEVVRPAGYKPTVIMATISLDSNATGMLEIKTFESSLDPNAFLFEIEFLRNENFFFRPSPSISSCLVNSPPSPPDPVPLDSIKVRGFKLFGKLLNLSLAWSLPKNTNGPIEEAELMITISPLPSDVEVVDDELIVIQKLLRDIHPFALVANEPTAHINENILCLYLQLRLNNSFHMSNWSNPLTLTRNNSVTSNCTVVFPTVASMEILTPWWIYMVAAGVSTLVLVVFVVGVLAFVLCRNHRRKKKIHLLLLGSPIALSAQASTKLPQHPLSCVPLHKVDKWDISHNDIILEEQIGSGFFGTVYRGQVQKDNMDLTSLLSTEGEGRKSYAGFMIVAVKMLQAKASVSEKNHFLEEIEMMKTISSSGGHPHVVKMVGCVTAAEPFCLLTEYVTYGDLLTYLKSIRSMVCRSYGSLGGISSSWNTSSCTYAEWDTIGRDSIEISAGYTHTESSQHSSCYDGRLVGVTPSTDSTYAKLGQVGAVDLIMFAAQIASGMEYLASLHILHRDIACRNILVGDNKSLKITDFGMSRLVSEEDPIYTKITSGHLPWRWMALESLRDMDFTVETDVWAYGVTLWEIASLGGYPYPTIATMELVDHLVAGERLEQPSNCSDKIYQIMLDCWLEDPSKRPSFNELHAKFEAFSNDNQLLIQFPKSEVISCTYTSTIAIELSDSNLRDVVSLGERSPLFDYLRIQNHTIEEQNKNLLVVGTGIRRILSEPILEGGQAVPICNDEYEGDIRKRSLSNSYVSTPKRNSWYEMRRNKNFVWNQQIPQVNVIPAVNDD